MSSASLPSNPSRYSKISLLTCGVLLWFHIQAAVALFEFSWTRLFVALALYWISVGLGISMGYHRLHTHRSYKVPLAVEYFLALCGSLTLEGGPISWVATHRIHHQNSDRPGDPHSPRDGGWWAHVGWIIFGEANHSNTRKMSKYAPDLAKHRFYVWLNNYHWLPTIVLAALLAAIGGLPLVLWGLCFRVVFGLHATWLVNSATHMWGSRRFETHDDSRNNWWVALITFGEGWHNNHHAYPTSARHGLAWYEFDPSWIEISFLRLLGIATSVHSAALNSKPARQEAA
jgi:fatty-acid desaturase